MRAIVQLVMVMLVGFMALSILISLAAMFMAILLPGLGMAFPELGMAMGYGAKSGSDPILAVFMLFGLALMLLLCLGAVMFVMRLVGREPSRARAKDAMEETRLIQELYHGMSRMEKRIESLETLLLDRVAPPDFHASESQRAARTR